MKPALVVIGLAAALLAIGAFLGTTTGSTWVFCTLLKDCGL